MLLTHEAAVYTWSLIPATAFHFVLHQEETDGLSDAALPCFATDKADGRAKCTRALLYSRVPLSFLALISSPCSLIVLK